MSAQTTLRFDLDETRSILLVAAHERFGAIPAAWVVDHVLAMTVDADFPVRSAALAALERRMESALREGIAIVDRPSAGVFGLYRTTRPYRVEVAPSLASGSCNCPDFVRGSLALCKHLLAVVEQLWREGAGHLLLVPTARGPAPARLIWDPRLPLHGVLDRARGLRWVDRAPPHEVLADLPARIALLARLDGWDATPAARRVIEEELARARRRLACLADTPLVERELVTLARALYPHQRAGVRRFLEEGRRLLLADDMGLGKTTQAIAACHALHRAGRVRRGLVVVPASLKPQWLSEWRRTTDVPAAIVEGPPPARREAYLAMDDGFLLVGYEQLRLDLEIIQTRDFDLVVLDEAQRIKNAKSKTAAAVKALAPSYRLVLTGTPLENRLDDLASILDWIDDTALEPKWRLAPWHTYADGDGGDGLRGTRNMSTFRTRIAGATLRRVRKEVLAQLPPRTDTRIDVPMSEAQLAIHQGFAQSIAMLLAILERRALTDAERVRLMLLLTQQRIVSNGVAQAMFENIWPVLELLTPTPELLENLCAPKLAVFAGLVLQLVGEDRKVIVFSQWRRMLRLAEWTIRGALEALGQRAMFFTGAESTPLRTRAIADFHDEPSASVLFLSDAGSVGLNLQRAATACINLELPWNPAVLEQRIGRIYRLGQTRPVDVYNLVTNEGIESRIAEVVAEKRSLFEGVFGAAAGPPQLP